MTRLILDQGLPRSTVLHLKKAGWDVLHVYDIDLSRASDRQILEHARENGRIVVTLDADFHALLAVENASSPSVIRIRKEGLTGTKLAELLLRLWLIGAIRREYLDHIIVLNERHPYFEYYHSVRTHLSLNKQCPRPRQVQPPEQGKAIVFPHLGGFHHEYFRRVG